MIKDVEGLERFELVLLVHVVLAHDLLELGRRHLHRRPPIEDEGLRVDGAVVRRAQVGQQRRHLDDRVGADGGGDGRGWL